jgi:hypothetical protein
VEVQQAKRVRDGRTRLADAFGDTFLRQPELVDELAIGKRLVDRIEIRALDVLDERHLELVPVRELADERGDPLEAREARGTNAALAGDELVPVEGLGDEHGLQDAMFADARRQLLEPGVVHVTTRLVRVGHEPGKRHVHDGRGTRGPLRDQRGEPPSEGASRAVRVHGHATAPA